MLRTCGRYVNTTTTICLLTMSIHFSKCFSALIQLLFRPSVYHEYSLFQMFLVCAAVHGKRKGISPTYHGFDPRSTDPTNHILKMSFDHPPSHGPKRQIKAVNPNFESKLVPQEIPTSVPAITIPFYNPSQNQFPNRQPTQPTASPLPFTPLSSLSLSA